MKQIIFTLTVFFLFSCTDKVNEVQYNEVQFSDLGKHNMKIIPANPTSNSDIKLVVFDDCTYNLLSGVTRNGNMIDIQKQFNGMMKWPCMIMNDTILIGKLSHGTYTVNYKLVDIANPNSPQTTTSLTFHLLVSN